MLPKLVTITFIEIVYVIYILRFFKTRYSLAHPMVKFNSEYLKHPIGKFDAPQSNICKFGHDGAIIIALLILLRLKALYIFKFNTGECISGKVYHIKILYFIFITKFILNVFGFIDFVSSFY